MTHIDVLLFYVVHLFYFFTVYQYAYCLPQLLPFFQQGCCQACLGDIIVGKTLLNLWGVKIIIKVKNALFSFLHHVIIFLWKLDLSGFEKQTENLQNQEFKYVV